MNWCDICSKLLQDEWVFCPNCGSRIDITEYQLTVGDKNNT